MGAGRERRAEASKDARRGRGVGEAKQERGIREG
jgi:hypothetical protein